MLGVCLHSSSGQIVRARARRSSVAHCPITSTCCAASQGALTTQPCQEAPNIYRRHLLSALIAAGGLLLPLRPSVAEQPDVSAKTPSVTEPPFDAEAVATASSVAQDVDAAAQPDIPGPLQSASEVADSPQTSTSGSANPSTPKLVFMDVNINGELAGRITIQLFADVPAGATRFSELAAGRQGVDYRLSKFNGVLPTYIRNDGLSRLSYSATEVSPIASGDSLDSLEAELDRQVRRHDQTGLVSLIVREREARPVKERLVARDGKLITVLEQAGEAPNGTQFTITTAASPELDSTNLVIGQVVGGQELLKRIASLPVNKPRNDNPYFQAGKAMGDKRAVTAERAFYRPFQKVVVASSGVLS